MDFATGAADMFLHGSASLLVVVVRVLEAVAP